jgi:hypothetical protein
MMANDAPIMLLQWLQAGEHKETKAAIAKFSGDVNIMYADVQTKAQAIDAIAKWLAGNRTAQFLFIGTHGDEDGLGPTAVDGLDWSELKTLLLQAVRPMALWLGACHSSFAAKAWSPITGRLPVEYIVGFPNAIEPDDVEKVLLELIKMTGVNPITFVDQEIPRLRQIIPKTTVEMRYPAYTKGKVYEYVNFDNFVAEVGVTPKQFLER